jgi:RNA polymerase sigma-70 factor, ECF subfamily
MSATSSTFFLRARPPRRPDKKVAAAEDSRDAELVRKFKIGDESAFVEIMRRHQARIQALARSLLSNFADAEEITQDTFISAHRNLARFRGDCSLATWLHRIAVNLAHNHYWYFFRRRRHLTLSIDVPMGGRPGDPNLADVLPTREPHPAQANLHEEFSKLVASFLEKLEPHSRDALLLRIVQNLTYTEISAQLGINIGTVKSRIARARESLRARLAEACPDFESGSGLSRWFEASRA